jgi:hypothetical protein
MCVHGDNARHLSGVQILIAFRYGCLSLWETRRKLIYIWEVPCGSNIKSRFPRVILIAALLRGEDIFIGFVWLCVFRVMNRNYTFVLVLNLKGD